MASSGAAAMWGAGWAQNQLNALTDIYGRGYHRAEEKLGEVGYKPSATYLQGYYNKNLLYSQLGMKKANALIQEGMKRGVGIN